MWNTGKLASIRIEYYPPELTKPITPPQSKNFYVFIGEAGPHRILRYPLISHRQLGSIISYREVLWKALIVYLNQKYAPFLWVDLWVHLCVIHILFFNL